MGPLSSHARDGLRRLCCRLAGVRLLGDIHERAAEWGIPLRCGRKRRARIDSIARTGLAFVHVPKVAGTSISEALYGLHIGHMSIRQIKRLGAGRLAGLPSFAVIRHPTDRFLSAYRYACTGGGDIPLAPEFREAYRRFGSLDDALDHVEQARSPYGVDHIFRPQHWYLVDGHGRIAVDRLIRFDALHQLPILIPGFPAASLPRLNGSAPRPLRLSPRQTQRIERLYARDLSLWKTLAKADVAPETRPDPKAFTSPLPFRHPVAI